jgi:hypothetical protein
MCPTSSSWLFQPPSLKEECREKAGKFRSVVKGYQGQKTHIHVSSNLPACIFKGDVTLFTLSRKWAIIFLFT